MKLYDIIGIGVGPSNLSTAALIKPISAEIEAIFFDDKPSFSWHPGMMFPNATLQVSFLKDLVTMLDPTNDCSFLNYLKQEGQLYIFAARNGYCNIKRKEFEAYLKWVVAKLDNVHFNSPVESVHRSDIGFEVKVNNEIYYARNILMGAGLTSNIPECCKPYLSSTLFHSSQFLKQYNNYSGKEVTIIGGGQSSCEILKFILEQEPDKLPSRINWVFKNHKINVLEDTPFANELYTPNYSEYFYSLGSEKRSKLLEEQRFTSDGVSESTISEIYDLLYYKKFDDNCSIIIHNDSMLTDLTKTADRYRLRINDDLYIETDIVILGTGFHYTIPPCIKTLSEQYHTESGVFMIDKHYRLVPKTTMEGSIFIHNGARHVRGVADPNLSLLAWRSGVIINTLLGRSQYDVSNEISIIKWNNT